MKHLKKQIEWKSSELRRAIDALENNINNGSCPDRRLKYRKLKNGFRILTVEDGKLKTVKPGSPEAEDIRRIQRAHFDSRRLEIMKSNLKVLDSMAEKLRDDDIITIKEMLPKVYRTPPCEVTAVTPVHSQEIDQWDLSDSEWEAFNSEQNPNFDETRTILTTFGLKVRSKSEECFAELLHYYGFVYRYEPELVLSDSGRKVTIHPDFEVRVSPRRSVFIEHLGFMEDPVYSKRNLEKISLYHKNGFCLGRDLILTSETKDRPFDNSTAMSVIHQLMYMAGGYRKNRS